MYFILITIIFIFTSNQFETHAETYINIYIPYCYNYYKFHRDNTDDNIDIKV